MHRVPCDGSPGLSPRRLGLLLIGIAALVVPLGGCEGASRPVASAEEAFAEAVGLQEQGDGDGAIEAYSKALEADAEHAGALFNRGVLRAERGETDAGLADLRRAAALDPGDVEARLAAAHVAYDAGRFRLALEELRAAIDLDPLRASAYEQRGDAWMEVAEFEAAIADYTNAIRLTPDDAELYAARRVARASAGVPEDGVIDEALEALTRRLIADENDQDALVERGAAFLLLGEPELALDDVERALTLAPDRPGALALKGQALSVLGEGKEALEVYGAAIEAADPDRPDAAASAHAARASLYEGIGAAALAIADYERALALQPGDGYVMARMAWILSTASEDRARDAGRGLTWARKAFVLHEASAAEDEGAKAETAFYTDTLAAALAEAGRFEEAVARQREAIAAASPEQAVPMRKRLAAYKARQAHRE